VSERDLVASVYGARFGATHHGWPVRDEEGRTRFWILVFWDEQRAGAPVVYATLGAQGPDVLLVAAAPFHGFERIVEQAAGEGLARLVPLQVARCSALDTPFKGFLVAPGADGSFTVEDGPGAGRRVVRLVPLTSAERELAAREPREALDMLRAAGALVADPLRDCLINPAATAAFREKAVPATVRWLRRRIAQHDATVVTLRDAGAEANAIRGAEALARAARAGLAYVEAHVPEVPTDAALLARLEATPLDQRESFVVDTLVERALDWVRPGLVPESEAAFHELMSLLVRAHPDVFLPVHEVVTGERAPPTWDLEQRVWEGLLDVVHAQPKERVDRMFSRMIRGLVVERRARPRRRRARARHRWVVMVRELYRGEIDERSFEGHAILEGVEAVLRTSATLALDPGAAPLFLRLLALMERVGESLAIGFALSAGASMGEEVN
jgi:hypothetical protein